MIEVLLPRLGWTMEEGTFVEWLKRDGDVIAPGDVLFTVESDKSLNEVESFDAGVLRIPADSPAQPGARVPVGAVLAYIVGATDDGRLPAAADRPPTTDSRPMTDDRRALSADDGGQRSTVGGRPRISPRARRVAQELGVDWSGLQGSGSSGRIVERDVRAAIQPVADSRQPSADDGRASNASPLARKRAAELGVDLAALARKLGGKRIAREDVEQAAAEAQAAARTAVAAASAPAVSAPAAAIETRTPLSSMRRVIAERMATSARTVAPVTLTTHVDASELVRLRAQLKADAAAQVPSINDLLMRICAQALQEHPALNVRLDGDAIVQHNAVHIGLAVDTDRGLLVAVLREVQDKTLGQIASGTAQLIERARAGRCTPDELRGGTFTITNLGMYEIDAFTPIVNLPECAILGVGRIAPQQIVVDAAAEKTAIRQMVTLSLTFDHRIVDGAPAARFLQRVKRLIEQPYLWLVR
jgi:pyruvate dehydrogenase E2 component (dihydrolipoamide acetyltransferase)